MRNKKVLAWIICIVTSVIGVLMTILLIDSRDTTKVMPWAENTILITSFVISFVAFVFSMVTYFSIDAVNNITAMEGNVLENENYAIAYEEIIEKFKDETDEKSYTKKLLEEVRCPRKTKSCIVFADYIQNMLDHIILFAYVNPGPESKEEYKQACKDLVEVFKDETKYYKKLSNGIKYQFDENIKLIEYILAYQSEDNLGISKLENVRGEMLRNPISRVLYYDYLGLNYRRKASYILKTDVYDGNEYEMENMLAVMQHQYSEDDMKHVECLLERADICFAKAQELTKENILWEGYVSFNKVRVEIMKFLIGKGKNKNEIINQMRKVIRVRENVEYLFRRNQSYLNSRFEEEVERATNLNASFESLLKEINKEK